ncbi:MAG: (d)CMP kinase [Micavibrio aeruginosavorus]|uniref:Cytidylate kinase n=1 Tax=Micavibrio aeruginosavorus TaxID=349221 RepID=A0A2W5A6Q5_9BACT|nr:MAG: (d)CMP kinase [Micavibrio aeruginosavorus]
MVIAIDGPAASGKGTLARKLAAELGFAYLDTGALYRCVGKAVLDAGGNPADESAAIVAAKSLQQTLKPQDLQNPDLRTDTVGSAASNVAKFPAVRQALFEFQRNFAKTPQQGYGGVILDGRDIGTVIAPDADVKLFVTASVEERTKRRLAELTGKGIETDFETVLADMKQRDERDSARDTAPLKPADNAVLVDTSTMDAQSVMDYALSLIRNRAS